MPNVRRFLVGASLFVFAACGGGGGGPAGPPNYNPPPNNNPPPAASAVSVGVSSYSPANISVSKGTTVTWTWDSCSSDGYGGPATCVSHSVTFNDGSGGSTTKSEGTYSRAFATAGDYPYHCLVHAGMTGKVTVQ